MLSIFLTDFGRWVIIICYKFSNFLKGVVEKNASKIKFNRTKIWSFNRN